MMPVAKSALAVSTTTTGYKGVKILLESKRFMRLVLQTVLLVGSIVGSGQAGVTKRYEEKNGWVQIENNIFGTDFGR